ncbi:MAG TPA: hypothetical protein VLJ68_03870 [Chitinophagaceae bacterium]|nr:hypothetical protein [Chitinophagaceae bacterium]
MNYSPWHEYFQANRNHFDHLDWDQPASLTADEKKLITHSIQQFQRGENSEGKHFIRFAKSMQDPVYLETVRVFIKEEQDHAAILGRFMELESIEKIREHWLDNIFRWLRKLAGLEGTVTVLLTAEIMAIPYYQALGAATQSILLKKICKQVLIDEEMHLRFQCQTLEDLYKNKTIFGFLFSGIIHKILMAGTIIMVWFSHREVLKAGKFHFISFFRDSWKVFRRCKQMILGLAKNQPDFHNIHHAA